jgi:hypothetical protein
MCANRQRTVEGGGGSDQRHAYGLPTSIVLDASGRIVGKVKGRPNGISIPTALQPLLRPNAPQAHAVNAPAR